MKFLTMDESCKFLGSAGFSQGEWGYVVDFSI